MTRYTLRALATQWRAWSGTVAVLALAAGLVNVCLVHRMTVTRPDVVAAAWAAGAAASEKISTAPIPPTASVSAASAETARLVRRVVIGKTPKIRRLTDSKIYYR